MDQQDEAEQKAVEEAKQRKKEEEEKEKQRKRKKLISNDLRQLKDDEALSKQVEGIMLKSGMIAYTKKDELNNDDEELVKNIFDRNSSFQSRKSSLNAEKALLLSHFQENLIKSHGILTEIELALDEKNYNEESHFFSLLKELKKNRFRRNTKIHSYFCPFTLDLKDISTNDVVTVKGRGWKEIGCFSFCYEITQNNHFLLMKSLDLSNCEIRDSGINQLLYSFKINNIFSLISLNLSGNLLTSNCWKSFHDLGKLNFFQNLKLLNFSKNELFDEGIRKILLSLILNKFILSIEEIHLSYNSITNNGFSSALKVLLPLHENYCPNLQRFSMENNLVDHFTKISFSPLPYYVSV
jgi:actin-related protein